MKRNGGRPGVLAFSMLGDIALYCSDTQTEKHAMFVLSFGAGGQADGLHSCFHMIKPVTLGLWSSLGVFSFPGHHHWLGRVCYAFLLWISMALTHLSP